MKHDIGSLPQHYKALTGGPENYRAWNLSRSFHQDGYDRQKLLLNSAITLMDRAGLTADDFQRVSKIICSPSPLLTKKETLWSYAAATNLQFYFSAAVLRKSICELSNQKVDLTAEEKEALEYELRHIINYQKKSNSRQPPERC